MNLNEVFSKFGGGNVTLTRQGDGVAVQVDGKTIAPAILEAVLNDGIKPDALRAILASQKAETGDAGRYDDQGDRGGNNGHRDTGPSSNPFAYHESRVMKNGRWTPEAFKAQADLARRDLGLAERLAKSAGVKLGQLGPKIVMR